MSDDTEHPSWFPVPEEDVSPEPQQEAIIDSDAYPMRVLAGAGTGKTFTMVRKIDHLIDEEDVSPDRILALTFTNNAADSMREKLNAKLGTAGYDIDAYTYHSICNEILSDYAYEAGIDPDFEVATDAEKYAIVLEVLDDIEYRSVKPNVYGSDGYASGAASELLNFIGSMKRSGISPKDIDAFLGPADRVYELADLSKRVEAIASDHLGGRSVSSVLDSLPDARADLVAERDALGTDGIEASVRDFLDRLVDLCAEIEAAFEAHEAGERELPDNAYKLPKYLLGGYASGAPKGIPDDLDLELADHLDSFLSDCLTARDLTAGYAAYERELDERNLIDFDGLVVETAALMDSPVGEEIADRWDYVFCDEFQDTDRLQFDLVTSLVTDENLFVVGDDDQAIYEWRGANVANITDELDRAFTALEDEPLEENFRSRQPILNLANEAIQKLDHRERYKTLKRVDEPAYDGDTVATVELPDEDGSDGATQLRTVVQNLVSGAAEGLDEAYDPGDIALLVRKNDHATPVIEEFDDAGIPYQVAGDLATESVGVGTVTAYLKALARPEDEVSWNRVLLMRYRLCDADLRTLNAGEELLVDTIREAPLDEFEEPDRVAEAREHVTELLDIRDSASLSHLYRELTDITNIEWYLSEQERRDLAQLEDVIEQYGDSAAQPPLTPEFIGSLEHYDSLFDESGSTPTSQPDIADDAVNVMTIHKSKGLDFPVVLIPQVTADEWAPSSRTYDTLETGLSDGAEAAFDEDFVERDARETRRVFHVGITRAEDILVLQGGSEDDDASDVHPVSEAVDEMLPPSIPWQPERGQLPLWTDVQECLPDDAVDWTDTLASETVGHVGGTVNHDGEELEIEAARDHVIDLATATIDGDLSPRADRETLQVTSLSGPSAPSPSLSHSYTSLATYEDCPRSHYLDYVVNAFPDYQETAATSDDGGGVSQRAIGFLFHDTAEQAADQNLEQREEWYEICERLASQRRAEDALTEAKACIDRYFELELSGYEILDAEREFQLDIDGHELVGYIDAVYRTPSDELLVIDYKATERHRNLEDDTQLPIYLLACRDLYDEPVTRAGYAYVGGIGPKVETRTFSDGDLAAVRDDVTASMARIAEFSFGKFSAGEHCQWCQHNQLACSPDSFTVGPGFEE